MTDDFGFELWVTMLSHELAQRRRISKIEMSKNYFRSLIGGSKRMREQFTLDEEGNDMLFNIPLELHESTRYWYKIHLK